MDKNDTIIHIIIDMKPGELSPMVKGVKYVIGANAGEYSARGLEVGDRIKISDLRRFLHFGRNDK